MPLLTPTFLVVQFINTATGSTKLQVSDELESCTQEVQLSDPFVFQDRNVVFIDTPGFDDADADRSDADILRMVSDYLTEVYVSLLHPP
jgi:GTPase Era involved in 16S rRNA processing